MTSAIRNSEWDEFTASWDHGPSVKYVYRRGPGEREFRPWVVVAKSALLDRIGKNGLGLYAAKPFKNGDYIGQYDGEEVGKFPTRDAALQSSQAVQRLKRGNDRLITVRVRGEPGFTLIDGESGGAPYIQLCNDPRNIGHVRANTDMSEFGYLRVTHARIPAFDLDKTLQENLASELRWSYGDEEYWTFQELLGTAPQHALEVDD